MEYPSQVNEMWAQFPDAVKNYAKHYKTGEPMPTELLDKMLATRKFNQGFETTEYLKAVPFDQSWHSLKANQVPNSVPGFENLVFERYKADFRPVPPRYRSTYFSHVFASDEYSAGYFSYIWADVLVADSIDWFLKTGGLTRANGTHFRDGAFPWRKRRGHDPFSEFTGGGPEVGPLLRHRGLDEPGN